MIPSSLDTTTSFDTLDSSAPIVICGREKKELLEIVMKGGKGTAKDYYEAYLSELNN